MCPTALQFSTNSNDSVTESVFAAGNQYSEMLKLSLNLPPEILLDKLKKVNTMAQNVNTTYKQSPNSRSAQQ